MVKTLFPTVTLIENNENVGFSKANNQAVAVAKGEYICILNPDTAVAEDTFHKTIAYSESVENIGALGAYLMDGTGNKRPTHLCFQRFQNMRLFCEKYLRQQIGRAHV